MSATEPQPPIRVRRSRIADAGELAMLFAAPPVDPAVVAADDTDLRAAVADFHERISIPSGDDYFTLVATDGGGRVVGWCAAGGAVHQELKGWGEIYTLDVVYGASADLAARELANASSDRLALAGYEAVAWYLAAVNVRDAERADLLGFQLLDQDVVPLRLYARRLEEFRIPGATESG